MASEYLSFGSDFPTPAFELHADLREVWEDFKGVKSFEIDRLVAPKYNLLDLN
jgi:hypothetical protein